MRTVKNKGNKKVCEIDEENKSVIIKQKDNITIITFTSNKFKVVNQ